MKTLDNAARAVLKVGGGRGFVVEAAGDRFVITAAHCLPFFPPCHPQSYLRERVYASLLGAIGEDPMVWAECVFVDPIADIAVLGVRTDNSSGTKQRVGATSSTGPRRFALAT